MFDGSTFSSTDYVDYMDLGLTPPEDCQYFIAPIFKEFINGFFTDEEKNWLKQNNDIGMYLD